MEMKDAFCVQSHGFHSSFIANCSLNSFLSCTAVIFNILTIHALRKTSSLSKPLNALLLSLAVSDLGVGLLVQPFYSALLVGRLQEDTGNCTSLAAFIILVTLFSLASLFGVTALSVDRFLAIHLHLRYQELVTYNRVTIAVVSIWTLSVSFSLATLWIPAKPAFVFFTMVDAVCLVTTTLLNYKIYLAVRRHKIQIQSLQVVQHTAQNEVNIASVARLRKSAAGSYYVYLVFLLCYLPQICTYVARVIIPGPSQAAAIRGWSLYALTLVFLNSSLNPLIYCWKMRHIRHAVMDILRDVFSSHNPLVGHGG